MIDLKEPGLRERKRVATRRAIERAAIELSLRGGIENVTVDEIADAAGVSPRTFFNYFPSKEAAVIGQVPEGPAEDDIAAFLNAPDGQPILEGIRLLLDSFLYTKTGEDHRAVGELQAMRMKLMLRYPALFRQRMEGLDGLQRKMTDIVSRRLVRDDPAIADDPEALSDRARLVVFVSYAGLRNAWASWSDQGGRGPLGVCLKQSFDQLSALSSQVNV